MPDTLKLLCGQQPYSKLTSVLRVTAALVKGKKPFHQLTNVDEGHKQYWLRCLSTDSNARPKVQESVAFIEAELRKLR
jgi:hypothetical protein